jgi:hypothetical protein
MSSTDKHPTVYPAPRTREEQQAWARPTPPQQPHPSNTLPRLGKDGFTLLPKKPAHDILVVV